MNEQLQKALADLIGKASNGIDASVSFLSAEIPDVIHQLLMWYAVKGALFTLFGVIICIAWGLAEKPAYRAIKENCYVGGDVAFFYLFIGSAVRLLLFLLASHLVNLDWLQIWIAPKIWLIEYASQLAK